MRSTLRNENRTGVTLTTRVEARGVKRTLDEILPRLYPRKRNAGTADVYDIVGPSAGDFQITVQHSSATRQAGHDAAKAVAFACGVPMDSVTAQVLAMTHGDVRWDGRGDGHVGVTRKSRMGPVRRIT